MPKVSHDSQSNLNDNYWNVKNGNKNINDDSNVSDFVGSMILAQEAGVKIIQEEY
jgi:hypothetical protein